MRTTHERSAGQRDRFKNATISQRTFAIYCAVRDGVTTPDAIAALTGLPRFVVVNTLCGMAKRGFVERHEGSPRYAGQWRIIATRVLPPVRRYPTVDTVPQSKSPLKSAEVWESSRAIDYDVDFLGRTVSGARRWIMNATEEQAHRSLVRRER